MKILQKILYKNRFAKHYFHIILRNEFLRKVLFKEYNKMSFDEKHDLYNHAKDYLSCKTFNISQSHVNLFFGDKLILIPIKNGSEHNIGRAFAFLGHDFEVKETYLDLIMNDKINCFYDIGANYGHHSILFLSQEIEVLSFEPNTLCHDEILEITSINNFNNYELIKKAVGEENSNAKLVFPKNSTWLGKIEESLNNNDDNLVNEIISIDVEIIKLDDFSIGKTSPDIIKIDTEGFEINVLNGGLETIKESNPYVIFESFGIENETNEIFDFFDKLNYQILNLPLKNISKPITNKDSIIGIQANYLAVPESKMSVIDRIIRSKS